MCQDQQRSRWQAQQEANFRRERRSECSSGSPPGSLHSHSHHSSHQEGSNSPYSNSSHLLRATGYDGMYSRPMSADVPSPVPSWAWDMDASSAASSSNQYQRFGDDQASWSNHLNLDIPHLDAQSYDTLLLSGSESSSSSTLYTPSSNDQSIPLNGFSFPHRLSPDAPSPSPSPVYHHHLRQPSSGSGPPSSGRSSEARPEAGKEPGKCCSHCRATSTPLWRRDPSTMKPLCNACGLYLQQRNKLRPQELIDADDDGSSSEESDPNYVGPECSHCRTHHTSVWRRSKTGDQLCNACGVYARLRGKPRPLTLKKNKIRPRSKHSPK